MSLLPNSRGLTKEELEAIGRVYDKRSTIVKAKAIVLPYRPHVIDQENLS